MSQQFAFRVVVRIFMIRCPLSVPCLRAAVSQLTAGADRTGICGTNSGGPLVRPRHRPPCHYLPLHSDASGHQTHDNKHIDRDHQVCRHSTSSWTQEPGMQSAWPWVRSQQKASKAVLRKISLWLVRGEEERRMFVVSRLESIDCMCGLYLSRSGYELLQKNKKNLQTFGFGIFWHHLEKRENGKMSSCSALTTTCPKWQLRPFLVKFIVCSYMHMCTLHQCSALHLVVELRETFSCFDIYMHLIKRQRLFSHVESGVIGFIRLWHRACC